MDLAIRTAPRSSWRGVGVHGRAHLSERSKFEDEVAQGDRWQPLALMKSSSAKRGRRIVEPVPAHDEHGTGLSNYEYAPLAEIMGRVEWASEAFNCSAPDTGNMEVLLRYGTEEQKRHGSSRCSRERSAPLSR